MNIDNSVLAPSCSPLSSHTEDCIENQKGIGDRETMSMDDSNSNSCYENDVAHEIVCGSKMVDPDEVENHQIYDHQLETIESLIKEDLQDEKVDRVETQKDQSVEIMENCPVSAVVDKDIFDMGSSQEAPCCRVCHGESEPNRELFYPCKCDGSIKYIHQDCLMLWLKHSRQFDPTTSTGETPRCELCGEPFRFKHIYKQGAPLRLTMLDLIFELIPRIFGFFSLLINKTILCILWLVVLPLFCSGWMKVVWNSLCYGMNLNGGSNNLDNRYAWYNTLESMLRVVQSMTPYEVMEVLSQSWFTGLSHFCTVIIVSFLLFEVVNFVFKEFKSLERKHVLRLLERDIEKAVFATKDLEAMNKEIITGFYVLFDKCLYAEAAFQPPEPTIAPEDMTEIVRKVRAHEQEEERERRELFDLSRDEIKSMHEKWLSDRAEFLQNQVAVYQNPLPANPLLVQVQMQLPQQRKLFLDRATGNLTGELDFAGLVRFDRAFVESLGRHIENLSALSALPLLSVLQTYGGQIQELLKQHLESSTFTPENAVNNPNIHLPNVPRGILPAAVHSYTKILFLKSPQFKQLSDSYLTFRKEIEAALQRFVTELERTNNAKLKQLDAQNEVGADVGNLSEKSVERCQSIGDHRSEEEQLMTMLRAHMGIDNSPDQHIGSEGTADMARESQHDINRDEDIYFSGVLDEGTDEEGDHDSFYQKMQEDSQTFGEFVDDDSSKFVANEMEHFGTIQTILENDHTQEQFLQNTSQKKDEFDPVRNYGEALSEGNLIEPLQENLRDEYLPIGYSAAMDSGYYNDEKFSESSVDDSEPGSESATLLNTEATVEAAELLNNDNDTVENVDQEDHAPIVENQLFNQPIVDNFQEQPINPPIEIQHAQAENNAVQEDIGAGNPQPNDNRNNDIEIVLVGEDANNNPPDNNVNANPDGNQQNIVLKLGYRPWFLLLCYLTVFTYICMMLPAHVGRISVQQSPSLQIWMHSCQSLTREVLQEESNAALLTKLLDIKENDDDELSNDGSNSSSNRNRKSPTKPQASSPVNGTTRNVTDSMSVSDNTDSKMTPTMEVNAAIAQVLQERAALADKLFVKIRTVLEICIGYCVLFTLLVIGMLCYSLRFLTSYRFALFSPYGGDNNSFIGTVKSSVVQGCKSIAGIIHTIVKLSLMSFLYFLLMPSIMTLIMLKTLRPCFQDLLSHSDDTSIPVMEDVGEENAVFFKFPHFLTSLDFTQASTILLAMLLYLISLSVMLHSLYVTAELRKLLKMPYLGAFLPKDMLWDQPVLVAGGALDNANAPHHQGHHQGLINHWHWWQNRMSARNILSVLRAFIVKSCLLLPGLLITIVIPLRLGHLVSGAWSSPLRFRLVIAALHQHTGSPDKSSSTTAASRWDSQLPMEMIMSHILLPLFLERLRYSASVQAILRYSVHFLAMKLKLLDVIVWERLQGAGVVGGQAQPPAPVANVEARVDGSEGEENIAIETIDSDHTTSVFETYFPRDARFSVMILLLAIEFTVLSSWCIHIPLYFGRYVMDSMALYSADLVNYPIGLLVTYCVGYACNYFFHDLVTNVFHNLNRNNGADQVDTAQAEPSPVWRFIKVVWKWIVLITELVVAGLSWLIVPPFLIGYCIQYIAIFPFRISLYATPIFPFLQSWALGLVVLKVFCRCVISGVFGEPDLRNHMEMTIIRGFAHFDFIHFMKHVFLPVTIPLLDMVLFPFLLARLAGYLFDDYVVQTALVRFSLHGWIVLRFLYAGLKNVVKRIVSLHNEIRDTRYLVGTELTNRS